MDFITRFYTYLYSPVEKMTQRTDYAKKYDVSEKESNIIGPDDTVYRYLCSLRKIGSIIGIGGEIAKQLRAQTQAKIRISETIPGCDERVVTIYSSSLESNGYEGDTVSPAQEALFRVHDRVVAEEESAVDGAGEYGEAAAIVTVRLLVPSDQIGCVIGKGGVIIQGIRAETRAQVRVMGSEHLPPCALNSDELIQITGESTSVKNALYQVASRLHENPSRSQHLLLSSPSIYRSGIQFHNPNGSYKSDGGDWSSGPKEFALRLVCRTENLGGVIGKGGAIIKQIRQESGAFIVVDSSGADEDDCIISVSSKEIFESPSRTIDAVMRLQSRCSEKFEKDTGDLVITTRLLLSSSKIGCIIGKGGAIIKEMRSNSRANIRIFSDENVPKVALEDDEMVQITGDVNAARNALLLVIQRLRSNLFESDSYASDGPKYANRDNRTRGSGYSNYPAGSYNSRNVPQEESYESYDESQVVGGSGYGAYPVYSGGRSSGAS